MIAEGIRKGHVHSGQLERWLGRKRLEQLSRVTRDWYGPPIAVHGVPGAVYAAGGGDFVGDLRGGWEATALDYARDYLARIRRGMRRASAMQGATLHAGFSSLADLIAEAAAGKTRQFLFDKAGNSQSAPGTVYSAWQYTGTPPAGANAPAAPGGSAPTSTTAGAFFFTNPAAGETQHLVSIRSALKSVVSGQVANLILYDRLFHVAKTMNSTATEAVTGAPTRYQSTTPGAQDSAEGNFLFVEIGSTSIPGSTPHNWTVCTYTDQGGSASTLPSHAGHGGADATNNGWLDQTEDLIQWFLPLESGDRGIRTLTQMQCDTLVASGDINFVVGHPIALMGHAQESFNFVYDGINSAFNLSRIFDDAALAFLTVRTDSNTPQNVGRFTTVSG